MKNSQQGFTLISAIILLLVLAVGAGVIYYATGSSESASESDASLVDDESTQVAANDSESATATATPTKAAQATPTPVVSQAPATVTYATVGEAFASGKSLECVGTFSDEKGPPSRGHYYFKGGKMRKVSEQNVDGVISETYVDIYIQGAALYSSYGSGVATTYPVGDARYESFLSTWSKNSLVYYSCAEKSLSDSLFTPML